jgi:hypothetical protein
MAAPLSIRLSDAERRRLDSDAERAGVKPSTYVRQLIAGTQAVADATGPTPYDTLDDHERRLSRLEEMAGL